MKKYIPYEKLSKKEKRKVDVSRRNTWGEINPITRKPENSKAYNRKRPQDWKKELPNSAAPFLFVNGFQDPPHFFRNTRPALLFQVFGNTVKRLCHAARDGCQRIAISA